MNTNCLENRACPQCGQSEEILVLVEKWTSVGDDGTDDDSDALKENRVTFYDETNEARCPRCNYSGAWGIFLTGDPSGTPYWTERRMEWAYLQACESADLPPDRDSPLNTLILAALHAADPEDEMGPYNILQDDCECLNRALAEFGTIAEGTADDS